MFNYSRTDAINYKFFLGKIDFRPVIMVLKHCASLRVNNKKLYIH